jgi:hypothetical protein
MAHPRPAADPTRKAAFASGIFYLITFAASIPAALMLAPILTDPAYILSPGADSQVMLACLLDLVNALAAIGSAVAVFSVLRHYQEGLALGFVTTRMFEAATIVVGIVCLLAVVSMRQAGPVAGADAGSLVAVGQGLVNVRDWTFIIGPSLMPGFNALMFATVLYRFRLVPRFIPALGLIGAPLLITSAAGVMLGLHELGSGYSVIATAPIFVWELSVGLWMTFKGFNRPTAAPASEGTEAGGAGARRWPAISMPAVPGRNLIRRPASHRLWLVPGLAVGISAGVASEQHALGIVPVLAFGILPHLPAALGVRWPLGRSRIPARAVPLFNLLHQPLVPLALIGIGLTGLVGPIGLVAGLAWLGHIIVDLGMGDGRRDSDGRRRESGLASVIPPFAAGLVRRAMRSAAQPASTSVQPGIVAV